MNPEQPPPPPDELEAKITALLLGELVPADVASVQDAIAADPQLGQLRDRLQRSLPLVRAAMAKPGSQPATTDASPKLSAHRRERLLRHLRVVRPPDLGASRLRPWTWLVPMAAAAVILLAVGSMALWGTAKAKTKGIAWARPQLVDSLSAQLKPESGTVEMISPGQVVTFQESLDRSLADGERRDRRQEEAESLLAAMPAGPPIEPLAKSVDSGAESAGIEAKALAAEPAARAKQAEALAEAETPAGEAGRPMADTRMLMRYGLRPTSAPDYGTAERYRADSTAGSTVAQQDDWYLQRPPSTATPAGASAPHEERAIGFGGFGVAKGGGGLGGASEATRGGVALEAEVLNGRRAGGLVVGQQGNGASVGDPALRLFYAIEAKTREGRPEANEPPPAPGRPPVVASSPTPLAAGLAGAFGDRDGTAQSVDGLAELSTLGETPVLGRLFKQTKRVEDSLALADRGTDVKDESPVPPVESVGKPVQLGFDPGAMMIAESRGRVPQALKPEATRLARGEASEKAEPTAGVADGLERGFAGADGAQKGLATPGLSRAGPAPAQVTPDLATNAPRRRLAELVTAGVTMAMHDKPAILTAAPQPEPQPEVASAANPFSTFSLNVTDVSFKLAAASLEQGVMPDAARIRSEEFLNAFDYRDPEPVRGAPIAFAWERARYPFAHNREAVRFSAQTAARGRAAAQPLNLVLLLDNSGSMERADRVRIVREALTVLTQQLGPEDRISVVSFARTARVWVLALPGNRAAELLDRVGNLTPEGGTNLEDALNVAYQTAAQCFVSHGLNRVVLLTDGAANLGDVDPGSLQQKVEAARSQGIALDCFGIGWEGFNDDLLEVLSSHGDGRYGFINSPEEAAGEFVSQLAGALQVAAADVKVQVEFNPHRVTVWRQIGYAKHQLTKEQFRDRTVDAAELGASESGNALYLLEVNPLGLGDLGTVRVRYREPVSGLDREHAWRVPHIGPAPLLEQTSPAMRLAVTAAAFSEWLTSSPFAGEVNPDRLLGALAGVTEAFGPDERPRKLEAMIRQAKSISGQ